MSKKILYLILAISVGINIGVIATTLVHQMTAIPPGPPPGIGGDGPGRSAPPDPERMVNNHIRGITRHLELDEGQQQAIRSVMQLKVIELIECQMAVNEAGRRLSDTYGAPVFDPDRFRQLTAEAQRARATLDSLSAELLIAEAVVLSPDQRVEFAKVAPIIHSSPPRTPGEGGPPRRRGPPPGEGGPPPR